VGSVSAPLETLPTQEKKKRKTDHEFKRKELIGLSPIRPRTMRLFDKHLDGHSGLPV
jgi:hypothetical protein